MKTALHRQIERDCIRQMFPCFALYLCSEALSLALPVVTSLMIGDMADALLALDTRRISGRFFLFSLAFLMDVFLQPAVRLLENLLMTRLGFGYGNQMFGRALRLPLKKARSIDTATLVQRVDVDTTDYYALLLCKYARPLTMALTLGALIFLFVTKAFDPAYILALMLLAALPLLRATVNAKRRARLKEETRAYEEAREGLEYAAFSARDFLTGFGIAEKLVERMRGRYAAFDEKTGARQDGFGAMDAVFSFLSAYGAPLGAIAVGALLVSANRMGVGTLLSGYLVMPTLTEFYRYGAMLLRERREEAVVREKLAYFYAGREEDGRAAHLKEIRLSGVSFSYGDKSVLTDRTLVLPLDGTTRITGPNGAGKSTLLSLIAGIYPPDGGGITDERGRPLCTGGLRATVAFLPQDGPVFEGTVAENLFVSPERLREAETLLRELGFEKPLGTPVTENGGNLSPGERKKILLVRTLMKPAPVLALDEPLNHLDAKGKAALARILARDGRPLLLVSHEASSAFRAEKIREIRLSR